MCLLIVINVRKFWDDYFLKNSFKEACFPSNVNILITYMDSNSQYNAIEKLEGIDSEFGLLVIKFWFYHLVS